MKTDLHTICECTYALITSKVKVLISFLLLYDCVRSDYKLIAFLNLSRAVKYTNFEDIYLASLMMTSDVQASGCRVIDV